MSITLIHYNTFDVSKINISEIITKENYMECSLSINNTPVMIFMDNLKITKFNEEEILVNLKNDINYKKIFTDLDNYILSYIHQNNIHTKYNLNKFDYIPFINSYTNLNKDTFDVIKLKLNMNDIPDNKTNIFYKYGEPVNDLEIMKQDITVKIIVECLNITFDMSNKNIYIDNCVRQIKVKVNNINVINNDAVIIDDNIDDNIDVNINDNIDVNIDDINNYISESDLEESQTSNSGFNNDTSETSEYNNSEEENNMTDTNHTNHTSNNNSEERDSETYNSEEIKKLF